MTVNSLTEGFTETFTKWNHYGLVVCPVSPNDTGPTCFPVNGFVWVRFDACFGLPKLTFNPAVIRFSIIFKMGSFGKNAVLPSMPSRHLHRQRRRNRLALPPSLQPFQLIHGAM
jgi:hypothetical protein